MISQKTLDEINDLSLEEVIGKYVSLKKQGSSYVGLSPFTDEKSGSFIVSPAKGIWKDFSSTKGGGSAVSFIMQLHGTDYPDSIKEICSKMNIVPEYDESDDSKKNQELRFRQNEIIDINAKAYSYFISENSRTELLKYEKRLHQAQIEYWGIGWANNQFKSLTTDLKGAGLSEKLILDAGLGIKNENGFFDFFNNRIIFPIFNLHNKLVGFGGRVIDDSKPKYINTRETKTYSKSDELFGINFAKSEINRTRKANIVEGYYDVIAMHSQHLQNTVAPCGTALTENHVKTLKKLCDTIRLMTDGDKAGLAAAKKAIQLILMNGLKVEVVIFPEGEDPDSFFRDQEVLAAIEKVGSAINLINDRTFDGVEWLVDDFYTKATTTIALTKAQSETEKLLSLIPDVRLRSAYIKVISQKFKISKAEIEKNISVEIQSRNALEEEQGPKLKLPAGASKDDYELYGFVEIKKQGDGKTGYWFPQAGGNVIRFEQQSNFTIKPLFHIYSKIDNRRLIEIQNKQKKRIIDVPSKGFVGMTQFLEAVINEGNYLFQGNVHHFKKVVSKIMEQFLTCEEITTLGWQEQGFYAFADGIAETSFKKIDPNGIVSFGDENYFLPAFSEVYKHTRGGDDVYEDDRFLRYKKASVTFKEWAELFIQVHEDNGKYGIIHFIAVLFRDFIQSLHNVFPIIYAFGSIGTGKSFFGKSLSSIWYGSMAPFNLSAGTDVAFSRKLEKVRNALTWFDEYDNNIDIKRFQKLKGMYDGTGHIKGTKESNRTVSTKVNSGGLITSQYLPTKDDNSLMSRSCICTFTRKAEDLTQEQIQLGSKLKQLENEGLSSLIIEVVKYRSEVIEKFQETYFELTEAFKDELKDENYNGRILLNFTLVLVPTKILGEKLNLPFAFEEVKNLCLKMVKKQSDQIGDSDALRNYWKMVEFLFFDYKIEPEKDFKIALENSVNVRIERNDNNIITFRQPKKLLYLRFTKIQPLYMEAHRKQYGENGVAETSIKTYMQAHKSFVGLCPSTSFEGVKTSAFVFDYETLNVSLERSPKPDLTEEREKYIAELKEMNNAQTEELPY